MLAHPANAERLAEEGHADVSSFIPAYLIQGKPGYVARTHPTVEEAIGWIHDAAGVAIWAHPFWDIKETDQVLAAIDRYRAAGLDGVEVFYTAHTEEQTSVVAERCAELGMLTTGSADYHGPGHRLFSRFRDFELHGREPNLGPILHSTLAAPTPSDSADATRLCQGCSHPPRRLPGQAAPSFNIPATAGTSAVVFSPPLKQQAPHGAPSRHTTPTPTA